MYIYLNIPKIFEVIKIIGLVFTYMYYVYVGMGCLVRLISNIRSSSLIQISIMILIHIGFKRDLCEILLQWRNDRYSLEIVSRL